jgi:hypothetical protein
MSQGSSANAVRTTMPRSEGGFAAHAVDTVRCGQPELPRSAILVMS